MKLTIIGAGPGGYSAAFAAAKAGVEVTLVERAKLGGTCLHTGCIPTKTLRSSADVLEMSGRLAEFGITGECALKADMPAIVNRKRKVTATLQTGLEKTCAQLKVRVVYGKAELVSAKLVRVTTAEGTEEVESDNVIIATGSSPLELPALPVDHARVLSSDDALELQAVPPSLIIVGGGVIGCELAFIYRAFGSKVTVVEGQNRVLPLPSVDEEISRLLQREMKKKGIAVELARTVTATTPTGTGVSVEIGSSPFVEVANPPAPRTLEADAVCVTVGRVPDTDGLGLDAAGVKVDARGWIEADDFLETSVPGVYAIGDVIGPRRIMLAHMAVAEAHTAVHNILHPEDRKAQRYDVVPSAIFTANTCAIPVAADALEKNPANVMATWMVDRKIVESSISRSISAAFLLPCSARRRILFLLTDTTAISEPAKNALISVKIIKIVIWNKILAASGSDSIMFCSSVFC